MSVVIRMMRAGAKKRPFYRMVAADSRRQRDGRFLEILGHYDPMPAEPVIKIDKEKVEAWIAKGAQPSTQVASLLRGIGVKMVNASKPAGAAAVAKKKAVKKRAVARKPTERKVKARAHRAKTKAGVKAKAKETAAKPA